MMGFFAVFSFDFVLGFEANIYIYIYIKKFKC
jgi:hypothetical protein